MSKTTADRNLMMIRRGDIWIADLGVGFKSEQGGTRPVIIVQNNAGNANAPTVICVPVTSSRCKKPLPTHRELGASCGLNKRSTALCEQIMTIDKARLRGKVGELRGTEMWTINAAVLVGLGLSLSL